MLIDLTRIECLIKQINSELKLAKESEWYKGSENWFKKIIEEFKVNHICWITTRCFTGYYLEAIASKERQLNRILDQQREQNAKSLYQGWKIHCSTVEKPSRQCFLFRIVNSLY